MMLVIIMTIIIMTIIQRCELDKVLNSKWLLIYGERKTGKTFYLPVDLLPRPKGVGFQKKKVTLGVR